ncbi:MAG: serine/threonine-protein kinase [Archangium sp.]
MAFTTRRWVGVGVAILALATATAGNSMQHTRAVDAAGVKAQGEVNDALPKVITSLEALSKDVANKAERGARLDAVEAIVGQITSQTDETETANTFRQFEGEPFFTPFASVGPHAFFLGDHPLYSSDDALTEMLVPLARAATVSGTATALTSYGGSVWAVGVGRSLKTNPQQQPVLFALGEKLTGALLEPLATGNQVALLLVAGDKPSDAVGAGPADGIEALKHRRTSMKLIASPCCAQKTVAPGVELFIWRDPAPALTVGQNEAAKTTPIFFGIGGLIALVGLVLAFRAPKEEDGESAKLLRETANQLKQSQEQLQRLSQQLNVNPGTDRFAAATQQVAPGDDGLGSTQASVQSSRYEIVAPLGEGGMARVSVAVVRGAEGFRRTFVLKRLRPELAGNQEVVNQFIDEARLGASLVHSNIVPVFDFGRDADGYFLAQEYIIGRDVDAVIETSKAQRATPLELKYVLLIAQEALKALSYAHTKKNDAGKPMGLVHRDVSPNNLMVSARGEVKLLDFGIVKSDDRVTKTQAGVVKGNLFFMSPEQARALEVDHRSDLFSMGMVLFSALTGNPLYSGNNVYELMTRAGTGPTDADRMRIKAECGPLADVILRALSLDPKARFADAEEFARALNSLGPAATTGELQQLMETLFATAFAEERTKFAVQG